jgi:Na+/H+-dicarboxylate symporter
MLAFVILAGFYGIALVTIPQSVAKPFLDLMIALQEIAMKVVSWAMKLAPYAVFGLLCDIMIRVGLDAITGMAVYMGTVLLGLVLLGVFYLVIVLIFGRMSPAKFMQSTREALLLAFSTSSSAAVIPLSLKIADDELGVAPPVSKFVIPLGATINMGGTALYQVCAAVFLTQVFGIDLSVGALVTLIATAVGASIGSPSTPGVGIVILATILQGIGVPSAGIALIIGVDRILDMSRTAINVAGDLTACVIMDRLLPELQRDNG